MSFLDQILGGIKRILSGGTLLPAQPNINFQSGFTVTDDPGNQRTNVSTTPFTPGGDLSGSGSSQTVIGFDGTPLDANMVAPADGLFIRKVAGKWKAVAATNFRAAAGYFNAFQPFTTQNSTFTNGGFIEFDPTIIPATSTIKLKVIAETTGPQVTIQLYNVTDSVVVTGSTLTTSSLTPVELTTGDLTANLKNANAIYQVQIKMAAGVPSDMVSLDFARLEVTWA